MENEELALVSALTALFQYPQAGRQIGKHPLLYRFFVRTRGFSTLKRVDKLENSAIMASCMAIHVVSVPSSGSTNWKTNIRKLKRLSTPSFQYPQAGRQIGKRLKHPVQVEFHNSFSTLKRVDKLENATDGFGRGIPTQVSVPSSGSTNWKTERKHLEDSRIRSFSTLKRVDKLENYFILFCSGCLSVVSVPSSGSTNWKTT